MGRRIIRLGDSTTTGGKVITGCAKATDQGKPIARLGDIATCPRCRQGKGPIVEGEQHWLVFGIPVALEGHVVDCGCPWGTNRCLGEAGAAVVDGESNTRDTKGKKTTAQKMSPERAAFLMAMMADIRAEPDTLTHAAGDYLKVGREAVASAPAGNAAKGAYVTKDGSIPKHGSKVMENLSKEVTDLIDKSPTLKADLEKLGKEDWKVLVDTSKPGPECSETDSIISITPDLMKNPQRFVQTLTHEVGHANFKRDIIDYSTEQTFLSDYFQSEGAATLYNIDVQREIIRNGGADIGIAGNPANTARYIAEYEKLQQNKNAYTTKLAQRTIGELYGKYEIPHGRNQTYNQYYGDYWKKYFGQ